MGQRRPRRPATINFLFILPAFVFAGCDRPRDAAQPASPVVRRPSVVSLVPAASDLLIGMNATDHLVAVSNYDLNPQLDHLPRAGDYLTTDWEKISTLRPDLILTQYAPDRTPAGFLEQLHAVGARQANIHINRLADIFQAIDQLGTLVAETAKAKQAAERLREQLNRVGSRVASALPVSALLVVSETGRDAAGTGTYLDDLLTLAGGKNVLDLNAPPWPALDREMIARLSPEVIIQLLPESSPQVQAEALRAWESMPDLPAVRHRRIVQITDEYALLPGYSVGKLAAQFAAALHPQQPLSTRAAP